MNPRQRILAIRLSEKLKKNPDYAKAVGIEINVKKEAESNENRS